MATITSGLTLTGTGATSDVLSINKSAALIVASPTVQVGTVNLTVAYATTLDELNGTKNTKDTFLYLLNSSSGVETIHMQNLASTTAATKTAATKTAATATCGSGDATVTQGVLTQGVLTQGALTQSTGIKLRKGEFAFLPLEALAHVQFKGSAVTARMEYGYWTRSV